jgi:hypothetical protein
VPLLQEGKVLETLVIKGFRVLERVLLSREGDREATSSLENAIMSQVGPTRSSLVLVIASYAHYQSNSRLVLLAIRLLALLCPVTLHSVNGTSRHNAHRQPSLVAYLGTNGPAFRTALLQRLADR